MTNFEKFKTEFRVASSGFCTPSAYRFTRPINKDGTLTQYAQVLMSAYHNDMTITTRSALSSIHPLGWTSITSSKLVNQVRRGLYILTDEGKEFCEEIEKALKNA